MQLSKVIPLAVVLTTIGVAGVLVARHSMVSEPITTRATVSAPSSTAQTPVATAPVIAVPPTSMARAEVPPAVEPLAPPPVLSPTPRVAETAAAGPNLSFKDQAGLVLLVLGLALVLTGATKIGVLMSAAGILVFIAVPATTTWEEARDSLTSIPFNAYWSTVKKWIADQGLSSADITSYVSSLDTTTKALLGAAGLLVLFLALGAGAKSVLAMGGLAALFLVLYSVPWSDIKATVQTWEKNVVAQTVGSSNPLPAYCRVQDVGVVSLTDTKWALPQNCHVRVTIYQGAIRMQDNRGNTLDADAAVPWDWPHWFEPVLVWSTTPNAQAQFVFAYKK